MKKKIFLFTVMAALLVCLFAICASAAGFESAYTNEVTTYGEGPDWANLEDTASTAVIKKADGTALRIPAYYIFKANSNARFESNGSNFDFGWISEQVGEELTFVNLVAIEVPNGTKSFSGAIKTTIFPSLEELVVPASITSFPEKFLRDNTIIKKVFVKQSKDADGNIQGATSLPNYFADMNTSGYVSSLEYFKFELDYATSIGSGALSRSAIKEITLVGPLTSISNAFGGCKSLKTVYINNTAATPITIANQAFKDSSAITSVTLNNVSLGNYLFENVNGAPGELTAVITNVSAIGPGAFKNASNLSKIEISGSITSFGSSIFGGCHSLTDVKIINTSGTPVAGGTDTFNGLKALKNVTLDGIQIDAKMFHKVKTLEVLNLTNYTMIGNYAFSESNISSLVVPDGVTSIGSYAFQTCSNLTSITLSDDITTINNNTFQNCSKLESISIPAGIGRIGDYAFQNCKALTTVTFAGNANDNTAIAFAAFESCTALASIVIPEGVTTLGNCAFKGSGLTSVSFPTTLTTLDGGEHFYNTKLTTVVGLENTKLTSISYSMFRGLSKWKPDEIRLPSTVQTIAQYGFADVGAKVFKLGAGVQKIDTEAFVNCGQVEAYYLPSTITSFGSRAFNNNIKKNFLIFVTSDDANYLGTVKTSTGAADIITKSAYEADKDAYASGIHIISGYNVCAVFYDGAHAMAGKEVMTLTSYFAPINFGDVCTRSGCGESVVTSTIAPIFTYQGYSCTEVAINGKYSMSQFFKLDDNALAQYIEKTGTTFEYGLVASVSANPLAQENEGLIASGKTIIAPSSSFAHDLFGIGLNGITTEQQKATLLSFCAYVVDGGEVYYLDNGETVKTVSQKSFNDVLNLK